MYVLSCIHITQNHAQLYTSDKKTVHLYFSLCIHTVLDMNMSPAVYYTFTRVY